MSETGAAPENVKKAGTVIGRRTYLNLIEGANTTLTVADNSGTDSIDVTVASAGGGGSVPTGTGFRHVTAGVEDAATKLVDTADVNNSQITEAKLLIADNTTANVTSTAHGFAQKSPADTTKFLNGGATPAWSVPLFGSLGDIVVASLGSDLNFTTSSTALQNITGLSFSLSASATEVWLVEIWYWLTAANATMDAKMDITLPAAATGFWGSELGNNAASVIGWGPQAVGTSAVAMPAVTTAQATGSAAVTWGWKMTALIFGGGTSGTVQLRGAQNTSDPGQLTLKTGSFLRAMRTHT